MSKRNAVTIGRGISFTPQGMTHAARVKTTRQSFTQSREGNEIIGGALKLLLGVAFDILASNFSEKKKTFKDFSLAFAVVCDEARESIRESLKGADKKQWDACAVLKKDEEARAPKREELRAANQKGKLTGEALRVFRDLELTYVSTSKVNTIVRNTLEYASAMSASLSEFWNDELSANNLYRVAMKVQTSSGEETNPDVAPAKAKKAAKKDSIQQVLIDAYARAFALKHVAACNAFVAAAERMELKIRGKSFQKVNAKTFEQAAE